MGMNLGKFVEVRDGEIPWCPSMGTGGRKVPAAVPGVTKSQQDLATEQKQQLLISILLTGGLINVNNHSYEQPIRFLNWNNRPQKLCLKVFGLLNLILFRWLHATTI